MIYTETIPVDDLGRLAECPVCHNTQFAPGAHYCKICGMSRMNLCISEEGSVQHENPVNARFCEICGAQTLFFQKKLLLPWDEVPENAKKGVVVDDLPF